MLNRTLLLLDMDGVLIESRGYRGALRDTVDHFAAQMGIIPPHLTDEEITRFEASGMTNEWLSGAFCVAALVMAIADQDMTAIRTSLDATIIAVRGAELAVERPDFSGLTAQLLDQHPNGLHDSASLLRSLADMSPPELHVLLHEILADIHPPDAPVARVFQNLVLGQHMFQATYGLKPLLHVESYLQSRDRALLGGDMHMLLSKFLTQEAHGAAIYTARPSLPFAVHYASSNGYTPEAEMGALLLDLEHLPLIGGGHMRWLSEQKGLPSDAYCKPSPVHTLAALAAAIAGDARSVMEASMRLLETGRIEGPFAKLRGFHTQIVIYEDGLAGIQAGREAVGLLQTAGLDANLACIGIADSQSKRDSLARVADQLQPNIDAALRDFFKN